LRLFSGAERAVQPGYRPVVRWLTNEVRHLQSLVLSANSAQSGCGVNVPGIRQR